MNTNIRNEEDDAPESELSTAKRMTASSSSSAENGLTHYTFPRTGKRGVPQQFPRRLYEMLEAEEDHFEASADHPRVICWSESGRAFRIHDVSAFSTTILPLYFRTKKFSSFQRNLNLYGFAKVRRGPETDMYAHQAFRRDKPESLVTLRKIVNGSRRRSVSHDDAPAINECRPVSPGSPLSTTTESVSSSSSSPVTTARKVVSTIPEWPSSIHTVSAVRSPTSSCGITFHGRDDRGKLDLLALALERTSAFSSSHL